jgi:Spy/CpxP family protein refolding chaperone
MKKIIVSVFAIALGVAAAQAQEIPERKHDDMHQQGGHKKNGGKEMADLNLTEDQKTKFKALNEEQHKKMAELKKQDNITVKESREKMETLRKDHHTKMQAILTPEQKKLIEKKKEEHKVKMAEMDKARGERMKKELNLTDAQSAKFDASRKKTEEKMKSIRDDKSLTEEQKKEKSKELKMQQKESLKSILTEEQLKKLEENKKHRGGKKTSV